jgi:Na+/H+-dicarboxylate symporter
VRSVTNLIGNGVATLAIAKWERALDTARMHRVLTGETEIEADEPEEVLEQREVAEETEAFLVPAAVGHRAGRAPDIA